MSDERLLLLTLSGDIHLKSARTQRRFLRLLADNLEAGLGARAPGARLVDAPRGRMTVRADDPEVLDAAADACARTFGVLRVTDAVRFRVDGLDDLVEEVARRAAPRVAGRTFAVRVRRRGNHAWRSADAERAIGARLLDASGGVDLGDPEVEVRVELYGDEAYLLGPPRPGADGAPLGVQPRLLALLSGGFDSPVAAWLMMRRGCPVDLLHLQMDCSQGDHAIAVGYELWRRWGAGTSPVVWLVDFAEVKDALMAHVEPTHRQVALKQQMFRAASRLAARNQPPGPYPALVSGDSVGQVSTQTVQNLAQIDAAHDHPVLRPLSGFTKDEIVGWSRRIGTHDLSARAREVCDLVPSGPVETAARAGRLARATAGLPGDLLDRALATTRVLSIEHWSPGSELVPVVPETPDGLPVVDVDRAGAHGAVPDTRGPVAFRGPGAVAAASRRQATGREALVLRHGRPLAAAG